MEVVIVAVWVAVLDLLLMIILLMLLLLFKLATNCFLGCLVLLLLNVRGCFGQCSTQSSFGFPNSPDCQSPSVDDSELDASGLSDGVCASTNELMLDVR